MNVVHDPARSRFELLVDGELSVCQYRRLGDVVQIVHTEVPPSLQGHGVAARLVESALAWARAEGLRVQPLCSYVAVYMRRHPETQDLLVR